MINEFLNYSHLSSVSLQLIWKIIGTLTCSWLMGQGRTLMAIDREEVTRPQWQEGVSQEYPCNCQQMTKQVIYNELLELPLLQRIVSAGVCYKLEI